MSSATSSSVSLCFLGRGPSTSFFFASASCVSASASFWDLLRLLVVVYGVVLAQSFTRWQSLSLNLRWLLDVSDGYNLVWVPHLSSSIFILASFVCEAFHPLLQEAHTPSGVSSLPSFLFAVKYCHLTVVWHDRRPSTVTFFVFSFWILEITQVVSTTDFAFKD